MCFRASGRGPSLGLVALLVCVCLPFGALSCSEHSRSDVLAILAEGRARFGLAMLVPQWRLSTTAHFRCE